MHQYRRGYIWVVVSRDVLAALKNVFSKNVWLDLGTSTKLILNISYAKPNASASSGAAREDKSPVYWTKEPAADRWQGVVPMNTTDRVHQIDNLICGHRAAVSGRALSREHDLPSIRALGCARRWFLTSRHRLSANLSANASVIIGSGLVIFCCKGLWGAEP